jgi:phage-related protein
MSAHAYQFGETDNTLPFDPIDVWCMFYSSGNDLTDYINIMDKINNHGFGVFAYDVHVSSPQPAAQFINNAGVDGQQFLNQKMDVRTITIDFYVKGSDEYDLQMLMHDIYSFFYQPRPYHLRTSREPGLRYLVVPTPFEFNALSFRERTFSLAFTNIGAYASSFVETGTPMTYDSGAWQYGQNLPNGVGLSYHFTANSFQVYNAGDVTLDPRNGITLKIVLKGVGTPTIKNITTGDTFTLNKELTLSDTLTIDGVYPYLNGERCGRDTNHGIIRLAGRDWHNGQDDSYQYNQFQISGMTDIDVQFITRFLYK